MGRAAISALMILYCVAIWAILDFAWSSLSSRSVGSPRIAHPGFHHTLAGNFDGFAIYAEHLHRLYTNSLGFKDATVRRVPLKTSTRRVVLIGDSFTEGVGLPFEDTFAGMLYAAGQEHSPKIEFLNAGVASYSPTIYYRKIKYFLDQGLRFDELVVFPDMSDVLDEASRYFCIDEDPVYRSYCAGDVFSRVEFNIGRFLQTRFVMTDTIRMHIKSVLHDWRSPGKNPRLERSYFDRWAAPDFDPHAHFNAPLFAPLGVEGGIARSLGQMQKLLELTRAHGIKLSVVVYPYGSQIAYGQRNNRYIDMYLDFCERNGIRFINLFPAFFAAADAHADWRKRYFFFNDFHYTAEGNRLLFEQLARSLL
jgi:lysophospholipase L1-like esterase